MAKKTIRLTESELRNMIKESVQKILSEGQGWDTFKYLNEPTIDDVDDTYNNGEFRKDLRNFAKDKSVRDFINYGGNADKQLGYYNPKDPVGSSVYHDGYKPINKGTMGKVGRAAGVAAGVGALAAKRGASKIRKAFQKKNKGEGDYDGFTL